jgi:type IV pilus assembly protein PilF
MKFMVRLMVILLPSCLLAGCAMSPTSQSRVQAPASQEVVRGEARTRAKAHTDLGFEYYAQHQFGVALQEAKVALHDDGSYTPAHNLLALVYMSLGDNKSAEESFLSAMQLSPGDPELANNYGWFLCQTKREQQSLRYFNEALQNTLYPTPQIALANFAGCALKIHDYKAAETSLQRALAMDPNNARALFLTATLKFQQKQYDAAGAYIVQLHRNTEPDAGSAFLSYRIARLTGNRDDEARYLALLRKKFPDSDEYRKLLQGILE